MRRVPRGGKAKPNDPDLAPPTDGDADATIAQEPAARAKSRSKAKTGSLNRKPPETPEQLARRRKRTMVRRIWGAIFAAAGVIALISLWEFGSMLFEKEGPVPLDLAAFEADKANNNVKDWLNAQPPGYSRHVAVFNASIYTFEYKQSSDTKEFLYQLVGPANDIRGEVEKTLAALAKDEIPLEKVRNQPPSPNRCRILLRCTSDKPVKMRDEKNFFAGVGDVGAEKAFIGVLRPYAAMEASIRQEISASRAFKKLGIDEAPGYLYVLTLGQRPPDSMLAIGCFVGPLLVIAIGAVLIVTESRR